MDNEELLKTEKQRKAVISFLYWGIIGVFVFLGVKYLLPVLLPFIIAYAAAWVLNRPISFLARKTKIPRAVSALILVLLFFTVAALLLVLIGTPLVSGIEKLIKHLPQVFEESIVPDINYVFGLIQDFVVGFDPTAGERMEQTAENIIPLISKSAISLGSMLIGPFGGFISSVPKGLLKTVITIIASVFIAADFANVKGFIDKLMPEKAKPVFHECGCFFSRTVSKCILPYILIFTITFLEIWIGLALLKVKSSATIAIMIALMDILPVLGTGTFLIPWSLISLLRHKIGLGIGLAVLYVVITFIRNTLEPKLVGHQINLHHVLTFAAMLTGLQFFGFFGMLGCPLLLAFIKDLHDKGIVRIKFLDK